MNENDIVKMTIETKKGKKYFEGKGLIGVFFQEDGKGDLIQILNDCDCEDTLKMLDILTIQHIKSMIKEGKERVALKLYTEAVFELEKEWSDYE